MAPLWTRTATKNCETLTNQQELEEDSGFQPGEYVMSHELRTPPDHLTTQVTELRIWKEVSEVNAEDILLQCLHVVPKAPTISIILGPEMLY